MGLILSSLVRKSHHIVELNSVARYTVALYYINFLCKRFNLVETLTYLTPFIKVFLANSVNRDYWAL